jgi:curli biogenesis system outer membrane secretion channel CsgG
MKTFDRLGPVGACAAAVVMVMAGCADLPRSEAPRVEAHASARALKALPRRSGALPAVSLYEFRSSVPEIGARAATDMFKTALVQSGQFRVVERARVAEGVLREKQMNAQGMTGGSSGQQPLKEAEYLFEGTVSEATAGQVQRNGAVSVGGMEVGGGAARDTIGVDVRIIDARSGEVLDAVSVSQAMRSDNAGISGIGSLLATVLAQKGKSSPYTPDARVQQQRREGVDDALRSAINTAVAELARRFQPAPEEKP